jgi:hypothetical protein
VAEGSAGGVGGDQGVVHGVVLLSGFGERTG